MGTPCELLGNALEHRTPQSHRSSLQSLLPVQSWASHQKQRAPKNPPVNLLTPQLGPDRQEHLKWGRKDLAALGAVGLGRLPDIPAPINPPLRREAAPAEELQPMQGLDLAQCEEITGVI